MRELVKHAKPVSADPVHMFGSNAEELFLGFLRSSGYIIRDYEAEKNAQKNIYIYRIPNEELRRIFQIKMMQHYFLPMFQISFHYYYNVTFVLRDILFCPTALDSETKREAETGKLVDAYVQLLNAAANEHGGKFCFFLLLY